MGERAHTPGLIFDSFAGGGGASLGIEWALGRGPDFTVKDCDEALRIVGRRRASLSPAATSGSEAGDTGHEEADRVIARLMSSDPDFDDCQDAALLIRRLVVEHKGPDGYATWKDAALAARLAKPASSPARDVREAAALHGYETAVRDVEAMRVRFAEPYDTSFAATKETILVGLRRNVDLMRSRAALSPSTSAAEPVCPVPPHHSDRCSCSEHATPPAPAAVDGQRVKDEADLFARSLAWLADEPVGPAEGLVSEPEEREEHRAWEERMPSDFADAVGKARIRACLATDKEGA